MCATPRGMIRDDDNNYDNNERFTQQKTEKIITDNLPQNGKNQLFVIAVLINIRYNDTGINMAAINKRLTTRHTEVLQNNCFIFLFFFSLTRFRF